MEKIALMHVTQFWSKWGLALYCTLPPQLSKHSVICVKPGYLSQLYLSLHISFWSYAETWTTKLSTIAGSITLVFATSLFMMSAQNNSPAFSSGLPIFTGPSSKYITCIVLVWLVSWFLSKLAIPVISFSFWLVPSTIYVVNYKIMPSRISPLRPKSWNIYAKYTAYTVSLQIAKKIIAMKPR